MNLAVILKVEILIVLMKVVNGEEEEISAWKVEPAHYSPTHHKILEKEKLEIVAKQRSDKSKRHITQIEDLEPELQDYYKAVIDLDAREREQTNHSPSFQTQNNQFNDHRQHHQQQQQHQQSNYQQYNWNQNSQRLQNEKGQHQGNGAQSHHMPSYDPEGNPSVHQGNGHYNRPQNSHHNSKSHHSEHQKQNRQETEERLANEALQKLNSRQKAEKGAEEAMRKHLQPREEPPRKTMWEMEEEDKIHQLAQKHKFEHQERVNQEVHVNREKYAQENKNFGEVRKGYYDSALAMMTQDPNFVWMEDRTEPPKPVLHSKNNDQMENQGRHYHEKVNEKQEISNASGNEKSDKASPRVKSAKMSHHDANDVKGQHKNHHKRKTPRHEYLKSGENLISINCNLVYLIPNLILVHYKLYLS